MTNFGRISIKLGAFWLGFWGIGTATLSNPVYAADLLGVNDEKPLTTTGQVVDINCQLTGNCPAHCGEGKRQLGILSDTGTLYLAAKSAAIFAGAVTDLLPFCGQKIEIDGSTTTQFGTTLLYIERLRPSKTANAAWMPADGFIRAWAVRHKLSATDPKADEWYRHDATIQGVIKTRGRLGVPE